MSKGVAPNVKKARPPKDASLSLGRSNGSEFENNSPFRDGSQNLPKGANKRLDWEAVLQWKRRTTDFKLAKGEKR